MSKESEFLDRLKETFKAEAEEHRATMMAGLLELEKGEADQARESGIIESVFREAHSLKGAARAVGLTEIERLCQSMEEIFSAFKKRYLRPERDLFDTLYRTLDLVESLANGTVRESDTELGEVLGRLKVGAVKGPGPGDGHATETANTKTPVIPTNARPEISLSETLRISATRLRSIFLRAEELLPLKQVMSQHSSDLHELLAIQEDRNKISGKIEPILKKLRKRFPDDRILAHFLDLQNRYLVLSDSIRTKLDIMGSRAFKESLQTNERLDSLLIEARTALLLPFSTLLESFTRMVRDLAAEAGKEVVWTVHGDDIQIDRRVLEKIKDPLVHMVRNSISHGLELPAEREQRGKPRAGEISLRIERIENDKVELTLSDDGVGVDLARVKIAAIAKNYLKESDAPALSDADALKLIFLSDLSTNLAVDSVSGRGLGLAIARENIENIGGLLSVETTQGKGTFFRIQIPLSLATFRGVLLKCRNRTFVIPTVHVEQVLRADASMVVMLANRESIPINGRIVSLGSLGDILGLAALHDEDASPDHFAVVVLLVAGNRMALRIDGVLGEQEVLTKNLGRQLVRVRNVSGATVLVTGELVPILNPSDLMKSVSRGDGSASGTMDLTLRETSARRILVVDDSVTSRTMLKSILESAGYEVRTAVDGSDAFGLLRTAEFDLLVTDVEMPRMNGFDLCEKVRGSKRMANLPVVLVTSLDSGEDRERASRREPTRT